MGTSVTRNDTVVVVVVVIVVIVVVVVVREKKREKRERGILWGLDQNKGQSLDPR